MKKECYSCTYYLLETLSSDGNDKVSIKPEELDKFLDRANDDEDFPIFKSCQAPLPEYLWNILGKDNGFFTDPFMSKDHLQEHFNFIGSSCDAWVLKTN